MKIDANWLINHHAIFSENRGRKETHIERIYEPVSIYALTDLNWSNLQGEQNSISRICYVKTKNLKKSCKGLIRVHVWLLLYLFFLGNQNCVVISNFPQEHNFENIIFLSKFSENRNCLQYYNQSDVIEVDSTFLKKRQRGRY